MKTLTSIYPGICGFTTFVDVEFRNETGKCGLKISSGCPTIQKIAGELTEVDPVKENNWATSEVYRIFRKNDAHTACPLPFGIIKAVQVASEMEEAENAYVYFLEPNSRYWNGALPGN